MQFFRGLTRKKQSSSSASAERRKNEQDYYLKNGSSVLEELLALCDGNCRIPIRYFSAIEIERAIKHSESKMELSDVYMVTGSLDNRPVLVRFNRCQLNNMHRDMAITAQMNHLKNVLRLVGCCLEFEEPAMVYEYVEGKLEMKSEDGVLGTIGYIAPENGFYDIITQKIDIYSFGVLLFELLTGNKMVEMVDSAISKEPIDCEEVNKSNIEERNAMDTTFENLHPNIVDRYIRENSVIDIVDPTIFEEHGIEIQQQLEDYIDLVKRCTTYNGENRPYMIHVARELRRIEKCFRALTIG
ncbi:hypothetical protein AABB24_010952 [Solanum stoloniferum]|uniref:Protein kinase domain-containing protein n=1 Tax=Solanum stoloniferum TaxID=62892 RepID=A0ABD2UCR2_9SOLN